MEVRGQLHALDIRACDTLLLYNLFPHSKQKRYLLLQLGISNFTSDRKPVSHIVETLSLAYDQILNCGL
jgi:hypothetical protein